MLIRIKQLFVRSSQHRLDKLAMRQLYTASKALLEAEGALENAQATVDVLKKRKARLEKMMARIDPQKRPDLVALSSRTRAGGAS